MAGKSSTVEDAMVNASFLRRASWAALLLLLPAAARADDYEADLLRKFQRQNDKDSAGLKMEVEKTLSEALAMSASDPEKALTLLRKSKELLDLALNLPREQKD